MRREVAGSRAPRSGAPATTSATSATGAAGTPAAESSVCQEAVSSLARALRRGARRARRDCATRSGFVAEARVVDEGGQPDDVADRREQPVVAAGDHQLAVPGREHLIGRDHREPCALAVRNGAVCEIAGEVVADVAERRLVERDVDDRARARAARVRAARRARRAPPRCRFPGRSATSRREHPAGRARPSSRSGRLPPASARRSRARRGAARHGRRRRRSSRRAAGCGRARRPARGRARRRAPAGGSGGTRRRRRASRSSASRPRGSRSESASERLPAFAERNIVPSPFQNGGPQARPSSPVSGRSTLITSAPSAARIWAQYGPAIDVVTSSTRMPVSGRRAPRAHHRRSGLCEDAVVFAQMVDWVSGLQLELRRHLRGRRARRILPARPERVDGDRRRRARRGAEISTSSS